MSHAVLGCIADDFTGATDLANNLVRHGLRTMQINGVPQDPTAIDTDALVIALKSRTIAPADAVAMSVQAYRWLIAQGVQQIYFKYCSTFDSTPQGNIGPVTDALLDAIHGPGQGFTIVCPAFPENHRSVFNGHLFVGDVLLSDSGMRHHPLTPMTDANLVRVMQAQTQRKVSLVPHSTVALGPEAMRAAFAQLQSQGVGVAVMDAISNQDLVLMGQALQGMPLVTAGSGVAIGLPQNWPDRLQTGSSPGHLPEASGHCAVISGSCSLATNAQVHHWMQLGRPALAINPLALAEGLDQVAQALAWAKPLLAAGPVMVYATANAESVKTIQNALGAQYAGELVERALSSIALGLVQMGASQLVVAGGETSGAVVQALGVERMVIGPQIDPGVPWTSVRTPAAPGRDVHVALKSGNFGGEGFFVKAFAMLETNP
jgi:uncharacterized protein YgbK (DUF1537 family)